jgi:ParB-like chromosome segregation protein Spo0J
MPTLPLSQITVPPKHCRDLGDIEKLQASIESNGLLHPITVTADHQLVAGFRRLTAFQRMGRTEIPVHYSEGEVAVVRHDENECRKPFTISERAEAAEAVKKLVRDGKMHMPAGADLNEYAAEQAGFDSARQLHRANRVVKDGTPELVEAMDAGDVSIAAAEQLVTLPPAEQVAAVKTGKGKEKAAEVRKTKPSSKPGKPAEPVNQEKGKTDDKTVQVDGLGKPVPDCVADVFFDPSWKTLLTEIDGFRKDCGTLISRINTLDTQKGKHYPFAHFGKAMLAARDAADKLRDVYALLDAGTPFAVCDACGGRGCPACLQTGYVTRHMHENGDQYGG